MKGISTLDKVRIVAIIAFVFSLAVFFTRIFIPSASTDYDRVVSIKIGILSIAFIATLFLVIIINPKFFLLFAAAFFFEGIIILMDGEITIGAIFMMLTIGIAVKCGVFRKYKNIKLISVFLVTLGAVSVHCYHYPQRITRNVSELILYVILLITFYLLFEDSLQRYFSTKSKKSLINDYSLSEKESLYVFGVLHGKQTKEIASVNNVSDATVRTALSRAYRKMEITDAKQLVLMTSSIDFIP